MKQHVVKCWRGPFGAILQGRKVAEWRKDDRGYEEGDVLVLWEWDHENKRETGRAVGVRVTDIERGPEWGIPEGYVVMSIRVLSIKDSSRKGMWSYYGGDA